MVRLALLLVVLLVTLTGCVEAEEDWTFDAKGGGTYELVLRWNADLWRRVEEVVGDKVMRRVAGRGFPLRPAQVRDGLRRLKDVEITRLEERDTDTGLRELVLAVRFKRLQDLLGWEVLAGRTLRAGPEAPKPGTSKKPTHAFFHMEPIAKVPVLDAVAALLEAEARPPPKAPKGAAERDPGPLARYGLAREGAELVWRMLKLPLQKVTLRVRVKVPGPLVSKGGQRVSSDNAEPAGFEWTFDDLRKATTDRRVRLRWKLRLLDVPPKAENTGRSR